MLSILYWINKKTLSHYFINIISDFAIEKQKEECDAILLMWKKNINRIQYVSKYSKLSTEWYFNKIKLWKRLCIDEKNINWNVFTIFTNPDLKQSLVWIIPWVKSKIVTDLIRNKTKLSDRLWVKEIALDMARSMEWIARELFPQATQVVDRFHVMKNVLWDIQAVRIRLRNSSKNKKRQYYPKKYELNITYSETKKELITRVRYQLFKRQNDWNYNQKNRWEIIKKLKDFEEIIFSYDIISDLFNIFDEEKNALTFQKWFTKISTREDIIEMQNSWRMIQNHLIRIIHYFDNKFTNAFAEWLNSRIQRFVSNLRWFKDQNYMLYRIITKFG